MCKQVQKKFLKIEFRVQDTRICDSGKKNVMRVINIQKVLVWIRGAGVPKELSRKNYALIFRFVCVKLPEYN
jgi:hypothetical protein